MRFLTFASVLLVAINAVSAAPESSAPKAGDILPGKYFVQMKDGVSRDKDRLKAILQRFRVSRAQSGVVKKEVQINDFHTFVVEGNEEVADYLRNHREVAAVHPNTVVTIAGSQENAPWGLVRISKRNYTTDKVYDYPDKAGEGVDVYVVDTGIMIEHPEFEGRAEWGASFINNGELKDGNGHGTHVSGTIASKTYGVAKKTKVIGVRVLDANGAGDLESVLGGMQYVAEAAKKTNRKSVANMSLGGGKSQVLNDAAAEMVKSGVHLVVAAGNDNKNACNYSPAGLPEALTVGAIGQQDKRAFFSNTGPCVDIFAPGVSILSTWNDGTTKVEQGTSMASPHVAGVMALVLAEQDFASVDAAFDFVKKSATANRLTGIKGAENLIAYNNAVSGFEAEPFPKPEPVVCKVWQCWTRPDCDECKGWI